MDGGQHQMSGQCRLNRDIRGFTIANFADHHYVRILAQYGAQASGKCHADFGIDLRLANTLDRVFNRIFDRQYIAGSVIQTLQTRI